MGQDRNHDARVRAGGLTLCLAAMAAFLLAPSPGAEANGLFENRSWQFQTSTDRANKAVVLDLIERKKGGFFDSFAPPSVTNHFTNCNLVADAAGNVSTSDMYASTSSPEIAPGSNMTADSTGNDAINSQGGDGPLNNDQSNTGNQHANVSDNTATVGDVDASGGTTNQTSNNVQNNTGNQTINLSDVTVC